MSTKTKNNKEYFYRSETKNCIELDFISRVNSELPPELNRFNLVKKRTYCNIMDLIIRYNNMILEDYDKIDEFIMTYLSIKWTIDKKGYIDSDDSTAKDIFYNDLYNTLFTPSLLEHIKAWVEDNYTLNIDESNQEKKNKKFIKVLQFTDRHCKIMQCISIAIKLSIPLFLQYAAIYNIGNINAYLEQSFDGIFMLFHEDVDVWSKLFESVYSKLIVTKNSDKTFWNYVEIQGTSIRQVTASLYQKLIVDIVPKYEIDQNLINLNHVFINNNIEYTFRSNIDINYKPLNLAESEDDLSDYDKISINTARINEGDIILHECNIISTLERLKEIHKIEDFDEKLEYYMSTLKRNTLQEYMLANFFSRELGAAEIIKFCKRDQYISFLIIMKEILIKQSYSMLPYIITAIVVNINEKSTLSKKILIDILQDQNYKQLISDNYSYTEKNNSNEQQSMVIKLEAIILNNKFRYNEYEEQDLNDSSIELDNINLLKKEILDFVRTI